MSSRSEMLSRIGPVVLFVLLMGASTLIFPGMTPLLGPAETPAAVVHAADRGVAILARAKRPYDDVIFSESLKAFIPDLVPLYQGKVLVANAPARPVILAQKHAYDFMAVHDRADRDGLTWNAGIGGQEVLAFAKDEAHFTAAMAKAGLNLEPSEYRESSPLLDRMQTQMRGVVDQAGLWFVPAHPSNELILYGPYIDAAAGDYRLKMHVQLQGTPARCRAAASHFAPALSVTREMGTGVLRSPSSAAVKAATSDPCSLAIETAFTVPAGGAHRLETPFSGASPLPMLVDAYVLEPAASAQSR